MDNKSFTIEDHNPEAYEKLRKIAVKAGALEPESVYEDPSREARMSVDLKNKVDQGYFSVPDTNKVVDFHQFYAISKIKSRDYDYIFAVAEKYNIDRFWAFNVYVSNFPSVSISVQFLQLVEFVESVSDKIYGYLNWGKLLPFIHFWDEIRFYYPVRSYLNLRPPDKIKSDFEEFYEDNYPFSNPDFFDVGMGESRKLYDLFKCNELVPASSWPSYYRGRVFYPLIPSELIRETDIDIVSYKLVIT